MTDEKKPEDVNPETAADIAETDIDLPEGEDECVELRATLAQCQQELAEAKNAYLRAHADFDNFRKRLRAERDQEFARGSDRVLNDLLGVIDDFERALDAAGENGQDACLREGVELIYRQLLGMLERYGVTPMDVEGQPFDPMYHDAVATVPTAAAPEHAIVGVIQRGYLKNGEVFRAARVAVAVAPPGGN